MRIDINPDVCTGHGRCYALGSSVFEADDEGHSVARYDEVPRELEHQALRAQANCPEGAITCT